MDSLVDRICTGAQLSRVYISYRILASMATLKGMNFVNIIFAKSPDVDPSIPKGLSIPHPAQRERA